MSDVSNKQESPLKGDRGSKVVIELRDVRREFHVGSEVVKALRGVSFKIHEGEFVTIMGTSGSGKSTLLNQLGCLDTPTSGEYILDGVPVRKMRRSERAVLRNRKIGFIFQNYNLLAKTTAVENVELPLMYNKTYNARAIRCLADRCSVSPSQERWSTTQPSSWPTKRQVTSTRTPRSRFSASSRNCTGKVVPSSSSLTTPR